MYVVDLFGQPWESRINELPWNMSDVTCGHMAGAEIDRITLCMLSKYLIDLCSIKHGRCRFVN